MTIVFQGKPLATDAESVSEFLRAKGVDAAKALVEYAGEVYAPGTLGDDVGLTDGAELNVFQIVAGG
ncbi:MAG: sulfur carrier protein ThiS [Lentisphaerae bacterium]|jgi:sulfur carrier protein ThiS|nr:sulfur carrier protein ThiS [Lentisphaerota bacterium]